MSLTRFAFFATGLLGISAIPLVAQRPTRPAASTAPARTGAAPAAAPAFTYEKLVTAPTTIGGKQITQIVHVAVNQSGEFVFLAQVDSTRLGIFTKDRVIGVTGEPLPNGAVARTFTEPDINAKGQIAFGATFSDPANPKGFGVVAYFIDRTLVLSYDAGARTGDAAFLQEPNKPARTGFGEQPMDAPRLSDDGKILFNLHVGSGSWDHDVRQGWRGLGLTLNGVPVLPHGSEFQLLKLNGAEVWVDEGGPMPAVSSAGEVAFWGWSADRDKEFGGAFTTRRGQVSSKLPVAGEMDKAHNCAQLGEGPGDKLFINGRGDVAFVFLNYVFLNSTPIGTPCRRTTPTVFGVNDNGVVLYQEFPTDGRMFQVPYLHANDKVVAVGQSVTGSNASGSDIFNAGMPVLTGQAMVTFDAGAINNGDQVTFLAHAWRSVDATIPDHTYIIRATPIGNPK